MHDLRHTRAFCFVGTIGVEPSPRTVFSSDLNASSSDHCNENHNNVTQDSTRIGDNDTTSSLHALDATTQQEVHGVKQNTISTSSPSPSPPACYCCFSVDRTTVIHSIQVVLSPLCAHTKSNATSAGTLMSSSTSNHYAVGYLLARIIPHPARFSADHCYTSCPVVVLSRFPLLKNDAGVRNTSGRTHSSTTTTTTNDHNGSSSSSSSDLTDVILPLQYPLLPQRWRVEGGSTVWMALATEETLSRVRDALYAATATANLTAPPPSSSSFSSSSSSLSAQRETAAQETLASRRTTLVDTSARSPSVLPAVSPTTTTPLSSPLRPRETAEQGRAHTTNTTTTNNNNSISSSTSSVTDVPPFDAAAGAAAAAMFCIPSVRRITIRLHGKSIGHSFSVHPPHSSLHRPLLIHRWYELKPSVRRSTMVGRHRSAAVRSPSPTRSSGTLSRKEAHRVAPLKRRRNHRGGDDDDDDDDDDDFMPQNDNDEEESDGELAEISSEEEGDEEEEQNVAAARRRYHRLRRLLQQHVSSAAASSMESRDSYPRRGGHTATSPPLSTPNTRSSSGSVRRNRRRTPHSLLTRMSGSSLPSSSSSLQPGETREAVGISSNGRFIHWADGTTGLLSEVQPFSRYFVGLERRFERAGAGTGCSVSPSKPLVVRAAPCEAAPIMGYLPPGAVVEAMGYYVADRESIPPSLWPWCPMAAVAEAANVEEQHHHHHHPYQEMEEEEEERDHHHHQHHQQHQHYHKKNTLPFTQRPLRASREHPWEQEEEDGRTTHGHEHATCRGHTYALIYRLSRPGSLPLSTPKRLPRSSLQAAEEEMSASPPSATGKKKKKKRIPADVTTIAATYPECEEDVAEGTPGTAAVTEAEAAYNGVYATESAERQVWGWIKVSAGASATTVPTTAAAAPAVSPPSLSAQENTVVSFHTGDDGGDVPKDEERVWVKDVSLYDVTHGCRLEFIPLRRRERCHTEKMVGKHKNDESPSCVSKEDKGRVKAEVEASRSGESEEGPHWFTPLHKERGVRIRSLPSLQPHSAILGVLAPNEVKEAIARIEIYPPSLSDTPIGGDASSGRVSALTSVVVTSSRREHHSQLGHDDGVVCSERNETEKKETRGTFTWRKTFLQWADDSEPIFAQCRNAEEANAEEDGGSGGYSLLSKETLDEKPSPSRDDYTSGAPTPSVGSAVFLQELKGVTWRDSRRIALSSPSSSSFLGFASSTTSLESERPVSTGPSVSTAAVTTPSECILLSPKKQRRRYEHEY